MNNSEQPGVEKRFFTCPHCGCLAQMKWYYFSEEIFDKNRRANRNVKTAFCIKCDKPSIWLDDEMVYPLSSGIVPNDEMPDSVKKTFVEAQSILNISPRGSCILLRLCLEQLLTCLGCDQKTLSKKIDAISKGHPELKVMMDTLRIAGNSFVHSESLEELDQKLDELNGVELDPKKTALTLSEIINCLVHALIVFPGNIKEILAKASKKPSL